MVGLRAQGHLLSHPWGQKLVLRDSQDGEVEA